MITNTDATGIGIGKKGTDTGIADPNQYVSKISY